MNTQEQKIKSNQDFINQCNSIGKNKKAEYYCDLCKTPNPFLFMVTNEEWNQVVGKNIKKTLCWDCYDRIRNNAGVKGLSQYEAYANMVNRISNYLTIDSGA